MRTGIILAVLIITMSIGCSVAPVKKSEFQLTRQELTDILKTDKNLTPAQQIVIKHAISNLKDAEATNKENAELQKKVVSESKEAGAGKIMYVILGIIGLAIVAFIVAKVTKIIP